MYRFFKSAFLLLIVGLLSHCEKDDPNIVKIKDNNLLKALIQQGVDKNGNGEICRNEAELVTYLFINNSDIKNLSGIEAFSNMTSFICVSGKLTSLDLSGNPKLESLGVDNNSMTSLNVSGNTALKVLSCSYNYLKTLDLSKNINLEILEFSNNLIKTIDVSNNIKLKDSA